MAPQSVTQPNDGMEKQGKISPEIDSTRQSAQPIDAMTVDTAETLKRGARTIDFLLTGNS